MCNSINYDTLNLNVGAMFSESHDMSQYNSKNDFRWLNMKKNDIPDEDVLLLLGHTLRTYEP